MKHQSQKFLSTKQLAIVTGLSCSFFEKARCYGGGPAFVRMGGRIRYRWEDCMTWIEANRVRSAGGES